MLLNKYINKNLLFRYFYLSIKHPLIATKLFFREPITPIAYLLRGEQGMLFIFLRSLNIVNKEWKNYLNDLQTDNNFYNHIENTLNKIGTYQHLFTLPKILYVIVRSLKPKVVIETGVAAGVSSAYILKGLEDNNLGMLYSIDYPLPHILPKGFEIGCAIPRNLRHRWKLIIGKSKEVLPNLLEELKEIDIFFHDSEHSYENMIFEFKLAWKYLRKGGLLLSDDIFWNNSFFDFAKEVNRKAAHVIRFGGIRK